MGSPPLEDYVEHELEHCSQRYNWDCGLACVAMLLRPEQRKQLLDNFDNICAEEGFGRLTWTIDLCYLLKRFNVPHCMYSTMLGVNEAHKQHSYYRDIIDQHRCRVNRRFEEAAGAGVRLERARLGLAGVLAHLRRGPAVLLVDAARLSCDLCKHNKLRADFRRWLGGAFCGHYIVLVGYRRGRVLFRDPALRARRCAAPAARLQRARTAPTDWDVLLVHQQYNTS